MLGLLLGSEDYLDASEDPVSATTGPPKIQTISPIVDATSDRAMFDGIM